MVLGWFWYVCLYKYIKKKIAMVTLVASKEIWLPIFEVRVKPKQQEPLRKQTSNKTLIKVTIEPRKLLRVSLHFVFQWGFEFWWCCVGQTTSSFRAGQFFRSSSCMSSGYENYANNSLPINIKIKKSFTSPTNKDITYLKNIGQLGHLPSFFGMNMKQVMYSKPPPPPVWRNPKQPPGMVLKPCK